MPSVVIIAGPNGAGKSTVAPELIHRWMGITEFVNADIIAAGLSAFDTDSVALEAGRIMLRRIEELAVRGANFAFETTLASRSFAPWIVGLRSEGYQSHLVFLWLPSPELALARVANRVLEGGHNVPESVVRRRYHRGLANLFTLYLPIVDTWRIFDATEPGTPQPVARSIAGMVEIQSPESWSRIQEHLR